MDLIDRYVAQVRTLVPPDSDVPEELRALITDTLEARAAREQREIDEDLIVDVLRPFGSPEDAALRYAEPVHLIGPKWYPTFEWLAGTIIGVRVIAGTIGVVGRYLSRSELPALGGVPDAAWNLVKFALMTIGALVVVLGTLEHLLGDADDDTWDPRTLPTIRRRDPAT